MSDNQEKSRFTALADFINKSAVNLAEFALLCLTIITVYAVCARYIFRSPSMHAVEVSAYLMLVITWFTVGWVHRCNRHIGMDLLNTKLTPGLKRITNTISELAVMLFCLVIMWSGGRIAITALERNYRSSSILGFPLWVAYLGIPIGGFLLFLAASQRLKTLHARRNNDKS